MVSKARLRTLTALTAILIPPLFTGCTQADKKVDKGTSEVKRNGIVVTSEKLTNFEGLADKIKNEMIPDSEIICTVGDDAINVGDYKLNFRYKQDQAKQEIGLHPQIKEPLLKEAKQMGVELTEREKKDLIDASLKKGGFELEKKFQSGQLKREDFEKQVLDMGLVLKAINTRIEQQLLTEIINNSLLVDAARKNGLGKVAFNKYVEVKHTDKYEEYLKLTNLTPNQVKDQILEEILADLMKQKIVDSADIADKQVYEFYQANKENFKHNGRYHWAQILIADPEQDFGAMTSVATDVSRKFPKLSQKEQMAKIQVLKDEKRKKAMDLVKSAKSGVDFATLANASTEDIPARASKTGGDMGYTDLNSLAGNQIFKNIGSAIETMSPGEIYPKPIKSVVGWHVIKLIDKQESGYIPFEEVKDEIKQTLARQNAEFAVRAWIIHQREVVPVRIAKRFESFLTKANQLEGEKKPEAEAGTGAKTESEPETKSQP